MKINPNVSGLAIASVLLVSQSTAQSWSMLSPTVSPSSRSYHAMCTDTNRNVTVVFSGSNSVADTWEFNGTTWTAKTPTTSPLILWYAGMTYDSRRQVCVLFGGRNSTGRMNDTWVPNA